MKNELVAAANIEQGKWFIKPNGTYAYMRIAQSSIRHYKLADNKVWGVSFSGGMTNVLPSELVHPASVEDFIRNILSDGKCFAEEEVCEEPCPGALRKRTTTIVEEFE